MKWYLDRHKYISETTRKALGIMVAHSITSRSSEAEIESVERELASANVYKDFEGAKGRVRRALFSYFKAFGCIDENEQLTELGRVFSSGQLSIQEFSFYYILNYKYSDNTSEYYPAQLILEFFAKLKKIAPNQCYLTQYDFSQLVDCNSVDDVSEEFVNTQLAVRNGRKSNIEFDVWAKMLVQAGILKRTEDKNLVVVDDDLLSWILTAYQKNYPSEKGAIPAGIFFDTPVLQVTSPAVDIELFKEEGSALQAFLFDGIETAVINKFIIKNKNYNLTQILFALGISQAPSKYYNNFLGLEQLIALILTKNEDPNVQNIGFILSCAEVVRPVISDEDFSSENSNTLNFNTGYYSDFEHNRIVFGAPGTGKSYELKNDCKALLQDTTGTYERVTFHPDYAYSHFVGTYKPVTDDVGEIRYEFVPGPFMRVYVDALKSGRSKEPQPHLLMIEEINRAKVAAVFGDVFQLLDRDDDGVSEYEVHASEDIRKYLAKKLGGVLDDFNSIRIPDNMFIWATMNSADQGVFPMDTAFKRRWNFEYLGINQNDNSISGKITLGKETHKLEVDWNQLRKAINDKLAKDYKVNEDKLMGPFFLSKNFIRTNDADGNIADPNKFIVAFKSKVIMYLYEDAAKQHKHKLFDGCDNSKYSSVCDAFDEMGIYIFGDGFRELYDQQGV